MNLPDLKRHLALPAIGSPMFLVSNPELVLAQCRAGIIGAFPTLNARPADALDAWLARIVAGLAEWNLAHPERPAAPFAANLIVHKSNPRLEHDLALCVKHRVPLVITSLGARVDVNDAIHAYGGIVMHDVINQSFARKAVDKGADGLILVAAGAGGHGGTQSPFAMVQETREWFDGPVALSGAIATGASVLAAEAMGADFAYIGSLFIATRESAATDAYKQAIVAGSAADIVYTSLFTGVHGNYLRSSIVAAGLDPDRLPSGEPGRMSFASGENEARKAWRDIWGSGQGIGVVHDVPGVDELVARLAAQYRAARHRLGR